MTGIYLHIGARIHGRFDPRQDYASAMKTLDATLTADEKFPGRAQARELREDCSRKLKARCAHSLCR